MALLIDGYNLLHATDLFGRGRGPGGFHRSRMALLGFLAARLDPIQRARTTVVFDASDAPAGLPHTMRHEGLLVRFARDYPSADALIEELIDADHSPRQLVVVSSDHRIQRAAGRRRATAIDSDRWYAEMRRGGTGLGASPAGREAAGGHAADAVKPPPPTAAEVDAWVREFQRDAERGDPANQPDPGEPSLGGEIFPPGFFDELDDEV